MKFGCRLNIHGLQYFRCINLMKNKTEDFESFYAEKLSPLHNLFFANHCTIQYNSDVRLQIQYIYKKQNRNIEKCTRDGS